MITLWLENLLAYSLQLAVLVGSGAFVAWALRLRAPRAGLRFWRALAIAAILLPLCQFAGHGDGHPLTSSITFASDALAPSLVPLGGPSLSRVIAWVLGAGIVVRLAWLVLGLIGLRRFESHSESIASEPAFIQELQRTLGTAASIRVSDAVDGPATIGASRPLVLLPRRVLALPHDVQRAIVCHELLHVRRRDWLQAIGEEVACAAFWFHPGVRVLASRLSLSREMLVDQQTIAHTGDRRAYAEALLAFADAKPAALVAVAPLIRRRHLSQRIALVLQEASMSRRRIAAVFAVATLLVALATAVAVDRFPISSVLTAQIPETPYKPGNGVSLPKVIREAKPNYTPAAMTKKIQGVVVMDVVVLATGEVGDVTITQSLDAEYGLDEEAVKAARLWVFEPGKKDSKPVPVQVTVEMHFTLRK